MDSRPSNRRTTPGPTSRHASAQSFSGPSVSPSVCDGYTRSSPRHRLLLLAAALALVGLVWGCAGAPGAAAAKPQGHFVMFERGDRALCCGLALLQDGGVVVVGRADMLHPRMPWAWATKILPGG